MTSNSSTACCTPRASSPAARTSSPPGTAPGSTRPARTPTTCWTSQLTDPAAAAGLLPAIVRHQLRLRRLRNVVDRGAAACYPLQLPDGPIFDPAIITALPDSCGPSSRRSGRPAACTRRRCRPDGRIEPGPGRVGRHNAMDKVIGAAILADELPITDRALLTSSTGVFRIGAKGRDGRGRHAGCRVRTVFPGGSVGNRDRSTLVGFTSTRGFNIYSGAHSQGSGS